MNIRQSLLVHCKPLDAGSLRRSQQFFGLVMTIIVLAASLAAMDTVIKPSVLSAVR